MQSPGYYKKGLLQSAAVATGNGTAVDITDGVNGAFKILALQIVGITTATVTFEATIDGINWVALRMTPIATGTVATTATADGVYQTDVTGFLQVRARVSAWTSGTITVTYILSAY